MEEGASSGPLEGGVALLGKARGASSSKHQSLVQTHNLTGTLKNLSSIKQDKLTLTTAIKNSNVLKRINLDTRVQSTKFAVRARNGAGYLPAASSASVVPEEGVQGEPQLPESRSGSSAHKKKAVFSPKEG